ncbi:MAG: ADOP family duplicated permease [Gemmatimonadota bacterium]
MVELPPRVRRHFRLPWRSAGRIREDVDDEIAFHLDMRTEELVNEGMEPREARERAEHEFGDVDAARRTIAVEDARLARRARWRAWLDELRQDLRFAARTLRRRPGFTAAAVLILALGIGASVGMFTVLNAVVLKPLPYPEAERLVRVSPGQNMNVTLADAIVERSPSLAAASGLSVWGLTLTGGGEAAALDAQVVDPDYFETFGVQPALGRPFRDGERDPAISDVVILTHGIWRDRFGGDPDVLGRRIELDGYGHQSREVVGVMPEGFRPPLVSAGVTVDVLIPYNLPPGRTFANDSTWYVNDLVARLAPGATVERAAREVRAATAEMRERYGGLIDPDAVRTAGAAGLLDSIVGDVRRTLWQLLAAVGLVLLLACANLANLLLARAEGERRELSVRSALGAGRGRLVRQQLVRGAVLATLGGVVGMALARVTLTVLRVGEASGLPRAAQAGLDARVLAFAVGAVGLSVLAFGLVPALRATGTELRGTLAGAGRGSNASRSSHRLSRSLVAAEVALAVVLVTGAGLMLNSFRTLRSVDPGMDASDVLALEVAPRETDYISRAQTLDLYGRLTERLAALPGVRSVGGIHLLPFTDANWAFPYLAEGHAPPEGRPLPSANIRIVTPGYLETVDIPVLEGRDLAPADGAEAGRVMMINRTMAERLWPGESALGREIRVFGNVPHRVVGVVGDVRQHRLDRRPDPEMYVPLAQWRVTSMVVMVEGRDVAALAGAAREAVRAVDEDVPVVSVRTLERALGDSLSRERFFTGVLLFFGLLALGLGAIGVYGVMAYTVRSRMSEFGIRVALGATPSAVWRQALAGGMLPVGIGLAVGLAAAAATSRLLAGLLYEVEPTDPATFVAVAVLLAAVAGLACWLPARRATRVDPAVTLRAE